MGAFLVDVNLLIKDVIGLEQVKQQIAAVTANVPIGVGGTGGGAKGVSAQSIAVATASAAAVNKAAAANDKLATSSKKAGVAIARTTATTKAGAAAAQGFGQQIGLAGKRYLAFVTATAVPFAALGALREAIGSVIEFDLAVTKVRQITGETTSEIAGLKQEFIDLSIATGTSAVELANITKTLAQAGIRGAELSSVLKEVAKVPLTPSFGSSETAVEGLLAVMNQFEDEGLETIEVFDVLANVSNEFAASSEDLFKGFARGGAAFEAIGGTFKEFAAVLAVVRQETRESATTVGTFFKTLSARLGDPKIQEFLRGKGIDLFGDEGQFVGPIEAIRRIADALNNLSDVSDKVNIATKIAGRRQVSRFLALTSSIDEVNRALGVANNSAGVFNKQAEVGLTTLSAQLDILVAKFNELFQELAEPVFIPLIQGFTAAATGAAGLLSALSPVIPIFTQIIAAGVGIKALSVSFGLLAKAAAALAAVNLSSLGSLAGVSGAGLQRSQPAGFVGPVNQIGGGVALAGVGASIKKTTGALLKSQLGQIAVLGVSIAALDHFATSANEAGNSSTELALEFGKAVAGIAIGVSLISGQSATAIGARLVSSIGGSLLGLAGVISTGIFVAGRIASEAIAKKAQEAADKINAIDINLDDGINKEIQELGAIIQEKLKEAGDTFRNQDTGEQSIGQFLLEVGQRTKNLFTGEGGLTDPTINTNKFIDDLLESSKEQINRIFEGAVQDFGLEFREGIVGSLKQLEGLSDLGAERIADRIISSRTQAQKLDAINAAIAEKQKSAQEKLAKQTEDVAARLSKIKFPSSLGEQLNALSAAVASTVASIDSNINAFDSLISTIGQIRGPDLEATVSDEAVSALIKNPDALGDLLGEGLAGTLGEEIRNLILFRDALGSLGQAFVAQRANIEQGVDFDDPQQDPTVFVNNFIGEFVDSLTDLPPSVRAKLEAAGPRIVRIFTDNIQAPEGSLDAVLETFGGFVVSATEQVQSQLKTLSEFGITAENAGLDRLAESLQNLVERTSGFGRVDAIDELLEQLGGFSNIRIDFNANDLQKEANFLGVEILKSAELTNRFAEATKRNTEAELAFNEARTAGGDVLRDATRERGEAARELSRLQALRQVSEKGARQALDDIDPDTPDRGRVIEEGLEFVTQLTERLKNIELGSILKGTELQNQQFTFETVVKTFGEKVSDYGRATDKLVQALGLPLTPADVTPAIAPNISAQGDTGVFERTPADVLDLNQAAFGVENLQSLFEALNKARLDIREESPGLLNDEEFSRGIDVVVEETVRLAEAGGKFTGNLKNLAENIENFLRGDLNNPEISPVDIASITPETREYLQSLSRLRAETDKAAASNTANNQSIEASIASRAETEQATVVSTTPRTTEEVTGLSFEKFFAAELDAIKGKLDTLPPGEVISPETLQPQPDAGGPVSALDPAQLESALTGAITASLSSTLPILVQPIIEATTGLEGDEGSAIDVSEAASQLANATQAAQETTIGIIAGGEALQVGTQQLASASEGLFAGISELAAVVDTQREAARTSDTTEIVSATNELAAINKDSIEALKQQNESIIGLNEKLDQRIAQVENPEPIPIEDITIEGLEESNTVTEANSEALASSRESSDALGDELSKTQAALAEGLTAKIESVQKIQVDVRGLEDTVQEFSDEFEAVAEAVAKQQIKIALNQLANTLGNPELSQNARTVADGLT